MSMQQIQSNAERVALQEKLFLAFPSSNKASLEVLFFFLLVFKSQIKVS